MKQLRILVAFAFAFTLQFTNVCHGDMRPLSLGFGSTSRNATSDLLIRKAAVDDALGEERRTSPRQLEWSLVDLSKVLEESDTRDIALAAVDSIEFYANPEPSSILVWAAMAASLFAAGYGYKRRRAPTMRTDLPAA